MSPHLKEIAAELERCRANPARFNETILGRDVEDGHGNRGYWPRQREICRSVVEKAVTLVPTGNGVGKSFLDAGLLHWFLIAHPGSLVVATASSQVQLEEVLWKEVERAYRGARIPLGGRLLRSPLKVDLGGGWQALAYSTTKVERFSGHHNPDLFTVVDEASGVEDPIYEAIASLNPSRELLTGNPLRPDGVFYERCQRARRGESPLTNLIQVSSLESPHIHLARSPWGLADRTWLEKARNDYGEGSLWWTCHVLGLFPGTSTDAVIPSSWLDRAGAAAHVQSGPARLAIDLGLGGGGDRSVVAVRDDNGLLDLGSGSTWSLEATAGEAARRSRRWSVAPHDVSWDVEGIGADFANRLEAAGLRGARPYRGGGEGGRKFVNLRSAAAWKLRQRLDPGRMILLDPPSERGDGGWGRVPSSLYPPTPDPFPLPLGGLGAAVPQHPFAIRPDHLAALREELQGLRYIQDSQGRICLERKEDFKRRLRRSPDLADCVTQLWAF